MFYRDGFLYMWWASKEKALSKALSSVCETSSKLYPNLFTLLSYVLRIDTRCNLDNTLLSTIFFLQLFIHALIREGSNSSRALSLSPRNSRRLFVRIWNKFSSTICGKNNRGNSRIFAAALSSEKNYSAIIIAVGVLLDKLGNNFTIKFSLTMLPALGSIFDRHLLANWFLSSNQNPAQTSRSTDREDDELLLSLTILPGITPLGTPTASTLAEIFQSI